MSAIRGEPDLALQFIDLLGERLRLISERLAERSFMPLPARLAHRLLHLADKLASADGAIPVSQAALADFAGATREAVAKTLANWRARGWVGHSRGILGGRNGPVGEGSQRGRRHLSGAEPKGATTMRSRRHFLAAALPAVAGLLTAAAAPLRGTAAEPPPAAPQHERTAGSPATRGRRKPADMASAQP